MLLVIDIGNTHVDLGLFSVEQAIAAQTAEFVQDLVRHTKYPTDAAVHNNLQQLFASLTSPLDGVAIGSVVTGLAENYANLCRPYCRGPVVEVTGRWDWGLHIDYDDADRVGVDRLAAAAVCRIAVNAGTIPSSNGNASDAPSPRSTVRRESTFLVMIMIQTSACGTGYSSRYPQ